MAEQSGQDASRSGRRQMNAEQMLIIHSNRDEDTWRSAQGVSDRSVGLESDSLDRNPNQFQKPSSTPNKVPTLGKAEQSLMSCNVSDTMDRNQAFDNLVKVVQELPNVDPMVDLYALMGNVYEHGNYCEFLVGMYEVEKKPVFDFRRMSGDGFVMDLFFRNVKRELGKIQGLIVDAQESDGEVFEDYSDDEMEDDGKDSESQEHLSSHGYLQLSYDPNLVSSWISKIKTRHVEDKNHMMGLMAHNATFPENRKIIVEKGGKELIEQCQEQLHQSNNAAFVRNTSALVKEITKVMDFDEKILEAIFDGMSWWVPGNDRPKNAHAHYEITESRETIDNLVAALFNLKQRELFSEEIIVKQAAAHLGKKETGLVSAYLKKHPSEANTFLDYIFQSAQASRDGDEA